MSTRLQPSNICYSIVEQACIRYLNSISSYDIFGNKNENRKKVIDFHAQK